MILGDACMYKVSREAYIKFEQGYKQKMFIDNLFTIFSTYTFMEKPGKRVYLTGLDKSSGEPHRKYGEIKSFWFKTFSHQTFTILFHLFYEEKGYNNKIMKKKKISKNLILDYLTFQGLAYWIMCDGSLQNDKKTIILHTQGFNLKENSILSSELTIKFTLNTKVIKHKTKYYVIQIPAKNSVCVSNLIKLHVISSMKYKIPC